VVGAGLSKLVSIGVVLLMVGTTGAMAFSQFTGSDTKIINSTAGFILYKENGHLIEMNQSKYGTMTVTGPNGVVHTANGQPPPTDGKLGSITSVSGDITYVVTVDNIAPGNWIEILFNITNLGTVSILPSFSGYSVSPQGTTITQLPKQSFSPNGVFTEGGGWVFSTTSIVPISTHSVHKVSSFFLYFGLASNTETSFTETSITFTLTIDITSVP